MENILQGVVNSSSVPQDISVFVSVCVWEIGKVTTGSSQSRSPSYRSQHGRTFHVEPLIPYRLREDCEDVPNTEDGIQGLSLRVGVGQGTPGGQAESIIYSGHLVTEREGSVFETGGAESLILFYK